jgi:hypothetical protein
MVPMLIVAWRDMISGDSGLSFEKSTVLGSGCSLLRVSLGHVSLCAQDVLRERGTLRGREHFACLLQRRFWGRVFDLLLL